MLYVVWIDSWQMQCCGDPFQVGDRIAWTLSDQPDRDWLAAVVGDDVAQRVTHAEEHHGGLPDDLPATTGQVLAISSVSCRYAPDPQRGDARTVFPVPGSGRLLKAQKATGWEPDSPDHQFNGYLVELRVGEQES